MEHWLRVTLLSDTTFSRGDGTAGEVDVEIVHDELGLPVIRGRVLRGLLRDAWLAMHDAFPDDAATAREVLGVAGDVDPRGIGRMQLGDAHVPASVREWVRYAVTRKTTPVSPDAILRALTDIRAQTARDRQTGAPARNTLRVRRVSLRTLALHAPVTALGFEAAHWRVLARTALGVRHTGLARNRGSGVVALAVLRGHEDTTAEYAALAAGGAA